MGYQPAQKEESRIPLQPRILPKCLAEEAKPERVAEFMRLPIRLLSV